MQPKTNLPLDEKSFQILKQKLIVTRQCAEKRNTDPTWALDIPYEVGLKLTNRCDLRCKHCFQWNEQGYHKNLESPELKKTGDLQLDIIEKVFEETRGHLNMLYLWGGEPLVYQYWDNLIELMLRYPTETVMCTNGQALKKRLDSLIEISPNLTTLVSIEGLEREHDNLRGKNTFNRAIENIQLILDLQKQGIYKGKVSVASVVSNELVPNLTAFCEFMDGLKINTLFINFPWYIPERIACEIDQYFERHYSWMGTNKKNENTWHSFGYHIDADLIDEILAQINEIKQRKWNIRIRLRPQLKDDEARDFILGIPRPYKDKQLCLGISSRIDVTPAGKVTPCKKFPEFIVGDLNKQSLREIWKGNNYNSFRSIYNNHLNPLCLKCEILEMAGL